MLNLLKSFNRNTFHFSSGVHKAPPKDTFFVQHVPSSVGASADASGPHTHVNEAKAPEVKHKKVHLSHDIRTAIAPGEKLAGMAQLHPVYIIYSVLTFALICIAAIWAGRQSQLIGNGMLSYLNEHPAGGTIDFSQLAQIFYLLGYTGLAQICTVLGLNTFSGVFGPMEYQKVWDFFAGAGWRFGPEFSLFGFALLYLAFRMLKLLATEIVVTNAHLFYKSGILIVRTRKIELSQIDRVDVNQTVLGGMFGYGALHIYTHAWQTEGDVNNGHLGVAGVFLPAIAAPHKFSALIDKNKELAKQNGKGKSAE